MRRTVTDELVRGALELERTANGLLPHRLPAWARAQTEDPQILMAESQPSGVRLVFGTRATSITLVTRPIKRAYAGLPPRPEGVYDLLVDGELIAQGGNPGGTVITVDMASGRTENREGLPGPVVFDGLPERLKHVDIWLPHNETTELVELHTDAPIEPAPPSGRPVWLHHGSSISQGSNAISPSTTWPALAAAAGKVELINLGLAGSALLDPFTSRILRHPTWTELGRRTHDRPGRSSPRATKRRTHRYPARGDQPASRRVTHTITLYRVKPLPAKIT